MQGLRIQAISLFQLIPYSVIVIIMVCTGGSPYGTVIRKFGCSKGVIIPTALLNELNLDINENIDVKIENGRIVIEPVHKLGYSLEDMLIQCAPASMALDEKV